MSTNYTSRDVYEYISQQANDPILERRRCAVSGAEFPIYTSDAAFYEKISPVFNGTKYAIPFPTLCPEERQRRRLLFRNERKLYKRTCDATGESIISIYSPEKPYKVYNQKFWWGDGWSALDYGREFDFTRTFTEQFGELMREVPRYALFSLECENCDYANHIGYSKDCYMSFSTIESEKLLYSWGGLGSRDSCDVSFLEKSQRCYECVKCASCYNVSYSVYSYDCRDCCYLNACRNCHDCYMCDNLVGASYCIRNVQYEPDEYYKRLSIECEMGANAYFEPRFVLGLDMNRCESSYGNGLIGCKSTIFCDGMTDSSNCKYMRDDTDSHDNYDCYGASASMYNIELMSCPSVQSSGFSTFMSKVQNIWYSNLLYSNCSYCFGCVGLRNASYCIFNTQYTKEEYEVLVPRIIEHMQETGERGRSFEASLSPFGYNETVAMDCFSLSQTEAEYRGYNWQEISYDPVMPAGVKVIRRSGYSDDQRKELLYKENENEVLSSIIICEVSGRPFRLIKQELEFYREHGLTLPSKHPDVRHLDRLSQRPGRTLHLRMCDATGEQILSVYPPDYPGKVYSQNAYEKEAFS